jgi:hypothetical protein
VTELIWQDEKDINSKNKTRNAYDILVGKLHGRDHFGNHR